MNIMNLYVYENRSMSNDLSKPLMLENLNVDNVQIHIPKEIDGTDMGTWAWWFVYQNAKREKYSIPMTLEGTTNDDEEEEYISTVGLNHGFTGKHGTVMYAIEALQADGSGAVTHEWHTKTYKLEVVYTLQGNQTEYDESESDIISALISRVNELIQSGAEIAEIAETIENAAETAQEVIDSIPADYSALSAQVDTNTEDIGGLKADLGDINESLTTKKIYNFTTGSYINTNVSIGSAVDVTPVINTGFRHLIIPCKKEDMFVVSASGGNAPKAWTLTDEDYLKLSGSTNNLVEGAEIKAEQDGYLIVNSTVAYSGASVSQVVSKIAELETSYEHIDDLVSDLNTEVDGLTKDYTRITDLKLLPWKFGVFLSSGVEQGYSQGMLPNDRMYTIVKLKKGSKLSRKTFPQSVVVSFGYKLNESDVSLTDYTTAASLPITITNDCIAYIGVRYAPVAEIFNNDILDGLDADFLVADYRSMYDKGAGVKGRYYGWVSPDFYCEGQHADTTGWTNSFSDVQVIHDAFDALATESNGYLARVRDYGVVYTGNAGNSLYPADSEWHMYEYETKQVRPANAPRLPRIAITCCMHGNEKMSAYAMHYLMYDLIHNATKNPVLSYLRNNCVINFIPICNPFGFMSVIPQRLNENGVNLNRNFPTYNWDEWEDSRTDGNGSEYGGQNYKGQSAGSETETQAMMSFYRNNYDAIFQIDLHTNGADTVARDMISSTLLTEIEGVNYDIMHSYFNPAMEQCYRLKPWINEKYGASIPNSLFYGGVSIMGYFPSASWWVSEANGTIGMCYEIMAGSSNNLLGDRLTPYSADTIKMAAEQLANFIYMMLANCKDAK